MRSLLFLTLLVPGAWACVLVYPTANTGPNFRVSVKDRGRAVPGLHLQLDAEPNKLTAVTNADGAAEFRDVPPGSHHLSTANDDGVGGGADIEVKRNGPEDVTVPLTWPSVAPIAVRSLDGIALYNGGRPIPTEEISVNLLDAQSGTKLQSAFPLNSGAFNLKAVAPGLYFLEINPSRTSRINFAAPGLIAIDVEPNATDDHLELDLGWTDCGLLYSDRSQCTHGELHLDQLRGHVADTTGAAIGYADISLYSSSGKLVQMLRSGPNGDFAALSPVSAGDYELLIHKAGFKLLREHVTIEPEPDHSSRSSLTVRMGIAGSCTVAPSNERSN